MYELTSFFNENVFASSNSRYFVARCVFWKFTDVVVPDCTVRAFVGICSQQWIVS